MTTALQPQVKEEVDERVRKLNKAISVLALHRDQFISRRLSSAKGDKHCAIGWLLVAAGKPSGQKAFPDVSEERVLFETYGITAARIVYSANDRVVGRGYTVKEASRLRAERAIEQLTLLKRGLTRSITEANQPLLDATVGHTHTYSLSGAK